MKRIHFKVYLIYKHCGCLVIYSLTKKFEANINSAEFEHVSKMIIETDPRSEYCIVCRKCKFICAVKVVTGRIDKLISVNFLEIPCVHLKNYSEKSFI